jgi:hypothetical protein
MVPEGCFSQLIKRVKMKRYLNDDGIWIYCIWETKIMDKEYTILELDG